MRNSLPNNKSVYIVIACISVFYTIIIRHNKYYENKVKTILHKHMKYHW